MLVDYFEIAETPCKSYLPDDGVVRMAVLAVHGFAGDKESSAIAALASRLCPQGAAVYCFDFPAHGEHSSDDLSVAACREALVSVAEFMKAEHGAVRKAVFATSFGGYMALRCLDDLTAAFGAFSLVLRAPAVKMAETFAQRIAGDDLAVLESGGIIECGFGRKINVCEAFLDELQECDVCKPYDKTMLVIHGTEDDVVTPSDIDDFVKQNPLVTLARIEGADHRFKGDGEIQLVVEKAACYLGCSFKLSFLNDPSPIEVTPNVLMHNDRARIPGIFELFLGLNCPDFSRSVGTHDGYCVSRYDQIVMFSHDNFYKLAFDDKGAYWLYEPSIIEYFWAKSEDDLIRLTDNQAAALELGNVARREGVEKGIPRYTRPDGTPITQ